MKMKIVVIKMKPKTILKKSIFVLVIAIMFSQFSYSLFPRYVVEEEYDIWSCANHDGSCQDVPDYICEENQFFWTLMDPFHKTKYCNQFEKNQLGCGIIRKAKQIMSKQYFEVASLCKDSGYCKCMPSPFNTLRFCTPSPQPTTWYWYPDLILCPNTYNYINI